MAIYFRLLTEDAYVQTGAYSLSEQYNQNGGSPFVYNTAVPSETDMPSTFAREWATVTSADYDWGAYGIGLQRSSATVTLPLVQRRSLLYMYDVRGTAERRTLVESTLDSSGLSSAGITGAFYTQEEYYEAFNKAGSTHFGGSGDLILPDTVSTTSVNELYSYTAEISGVGSPPGSPVQLYVSPTWLGNERPLFDEVYLLDDHVGDATGTYALNSSDGLYYDLNRTISLRQVRWLGGVPSENVAQINRAGDSLSYANNDYNYTNNPQDEGIVEDGVTYENTDAYNVVNLKRF